MISKEKLQIREQQKNTQLLKEREESKLKMTSNGAYFLPTGDNSKKADQTNKRKRIVSKNSDNNNNNVSTPITKATNEIAQKIEYLHKRIIKMNRDTEEIEYNKGEASPFAPVNEGYLNNTMLESKYVPKYNLSRLEYKGFYSRSGKKTAIVRYDGKMNYVSLGDQIDGTVLIVNSIDRGHIDLKDNKTGDIHSIEK